MAASSGGGKKSRVVHGHVYSILGGVDLKKGGKVVHKIIKIRNPWGSEIYKGDWSDKSPLWTPEFRK